MDPSKISALPIPSHSAIFLWVQTALPGNDEHRGTSTTQIEAKWNQKTIPTVPPEIGSLPLVKGALLMAEKVREGAGGGGEEGKVSKFLQQYHCISQWNKFYSCYQPVGGNYLHTLGSWLTLLAEEFYFAPGGGVLQVVFEVVDWGFFLLGHFPFKITVPERRLTNSRTKSAINRF